ncbi:MAG: hypothetical protein JNN15_09470 [Blastocatellia bacterium]|nr:hypothetical protein [Blastocatellia bacterium]
MAESPRLKRLMNAQSTIIEKVSPVIALVPDENLKKVLSESFSESQEAVSFIEQCFQTIPRQKWSNGFLAKFFNSWKASHLKMLAIYGLSCRLQRLAFSMGEPLREKLLIAAAKNAETSHEDLGLDYNGSTHAELYDEFAGSFLEDSSWQLDSYCLPEAKEFKKWIYLNMVVEEIQQGLIANMFSEIYNHAEYSIALPAFSAFIDNHYTFSAEKRKRALYYIDAHVQDETEVGHFLVVVEALGYYNQVMGIDTNYEQAKRLFKQYLTRLGHIMRALTSRMQQEQDGAYDSSNANFAGERALV